MLKVYDYNDVEIINTPHKFHSQSKKDFKPIDTILYHDEDGKEYYMDEISFDDKLYSNCKNVEELLKSAENILNTLKNVDFTPEILYSEYINKNRIVIDTHNNSFTSSSNSDRNCNKKVKIPKKEKNKHHCKVKLPFKALRKIACVTTVMFGLSFMSSSAGGDLNNKDVVSTSTIYDDSINFNNVSRNQEEVLPENSYIFNRKNKIKYSKYIQLKDTKLNYTSTGKGPSASTKKLDCDSYRPTRIAILDDDNTIIDTFDIKKNKRINIKKIKKQIKEVYGSSVNIQINVDGIKNNKTVNKQIGWTSINNANNLKIKAKNYKRHI